MDLHEAMQILIDGPPTFSKAMANVAEQVMNAWFYIFFGIIFSVMFVTFPVWSIVWLIGDWVRDRRVKDEQN